MTTLYEPVANPRFEIERSANGEFIRIKSVRNVFLLLFLSAWLVGWTAGGIAAFREIAQHFSLFLMAWLCGWALGWVFAAATIGWMIVGSETLRASNGDLEIGYAIGPWTRRKLYKGRLVRNLAAVTPFNARHGFRLQTPFVRNADTGAVRFDYGSRTVFVAAGLDAPEGEAIIAWLRPKIRTS